MASESSAHPGLSLDHCCRDALPGGYMTRLQAAAQGIKRALLFVGATALAVSIIIFLRILLTAHQLPRWHDALAHLLPFLN